jgi:2-methylisocitrate lyase-like PEP mutase family enzyme
MKPGPCLAPLLTRESPLLLPVAHDALSARLIERAGFTAASIGGFGIVGCRNGLPDLGLVSFGEISAAVRDIAAAVSIPLIVDADDGYGDVKNVVRTVRTYEAMGVRAIVLEDQASPKKCGHMSVERRLVPVAEAEAKLDAALSARRSSEFGIIARTDARSVEGLAAALERARRYAALGVDALFVEAPTSVEELRRIGDYLELPLIVNAAESGKTPVLTPDQYHELGFAMILYPATLLLRMVGTLQRTLAALRIVEELTSVMGLPEWIAIDQKFGRRT